MKKITKITINGKKAQVFLHGSGKFYIAIQDEVDETFGVIAYRSDDATASDVDWKTWGPAGYATHKEFLKAIDHPVYAA